MDIAQVAGVGLALLSGSPLGVVLGGVVVLGAREAAAEELHAEQRPEAVGAGQEQADQPAEPDMPFGEPSHRDNPPAASRAAKRVRLANARPNPMKGAAPYPMSGFG